jgi:glycerate 2-kinase
MNPLRAAALDIFRKTLSAIDVESIMLGAIQRNGSTLSIQNETIDLSRFSRVIAIAIGKAATAMARTAGALLSDRLTSGLLTTNAVIGPPPENFETFIGGHPLPNEESIAGAQAALSLLKANDNPQTLVLFMISGGGSALFEAPFDSRITLDDIRRVNEALVGCGAVIGEMNVVRRYLSAVKGGRLAAAASRCRQVSLFISDVNTDDLGTISSGPTTYAGSTLEDFQRIISRYNLLQRFPRTVGELIESNQVPDLTRDSPYDGARSYHLLLDNRMALAAAQRVAADLGYAVEIAADLVEGEVGEMAILHLERLRNLREKHAERTTCLLSGGEVICPVRGPGRGGRNQEFVLRAVRALDDERVAVLSAGTDGIDGNSPAAGAIADVSTRQRAIEMGFDLNACLNESDSFRLLDATGDTIVTGPTGNNVRDLRILIW